MLQRCCKSPREGPMYFVYVMTNRSMTLYTGITNNLMRRVREHKTGIGSEFTTKYKLDRLVYFERFQDVHNAIEREKRIKSWLRIKKIALIVPMNPSWKDLSEEWYERHQYQPQSVGAENNPKLKGGTSLSRLPCKTTPPASSSSSALSYPAATHLPRV